MSAAEADELAARLAAMLPDGATVRISGVASLGAQRRTLFLDILRGDETTKAVAQIASSVLTSGEVEKEASLLRAAENAGVVVPRILSVDASMGAIISEQVEGESIPRRILRLTEADSNLGPKLTRDCGIALAAIHGIAADRFAALDDLAQPTRYADEMETLLESLSAPHPTFRLGVNWLRRHPPSRTPAATLVHGDFRLGNFLATEAGLSAVLDWEIAHLGDPMEDLAWLCLRTWRFGSDHKVVGGFGDLDTLRDAYESAGGRWNAESFTWWTVARTLWWGLGLARQAQAYLNGDVKSIVLAASGRRVVELEYDLLQLLVD